MSPATTRFRIARETDVSSIVHLLADDRLGATREIATDPPPREYMDAFTAIDGDPNNELVVATLDELVVGVLQLTYIPNLTHRGSWRGMIEGVRVSSSHRSAGVGTGMLQWAIDRCRARACRLVQLTSDLQRSDSIAFYEHLGFQHSHAGMKLRLE